MPPATCHPPFDAVRFSVHCTLLQLQWSAVALCSYPLRISSHCSQKSVQPAAGAPTAAAAGDAAGAPAAGTAAAAEAPAPETAQTAEEKREGAFSSDWLQPQIYFCCCCCCCSTVCFSYFCTLVLCARCRGAPEARENRHQRGAAVRDARRRELHAVSVAAAARGEALLFGSSQN